MRGLLLLLILFYLIFDSINAQPNTFFKVYYSTPTLGTASSVIEAGNGNYIVALPGRSTPLINEKLYLTDSIGDTILTKTYCSGGATSIIKASDGNYLYITTTTPPCINTTTMEDFKVVKVTPTLDTIWTRVYPSPSNSAELGGFIRQLKDGNYLIGGYQDFADNLYKIDTAGNVIWQRFIVMDAVRSVIEDYDGNLVMVGEIYGPLNSWSVIKTDSSGQNVLWAKYYGNSGGLGDAGFHDIVQLPDSNYLLGGGINEFVLAKLTKTTGDTIWTESGWGGFFSLNVCSDGNIIGAGYSGIRLMNNNGVTIWSKSYNGVIINCIRQTSDGGFIAAGYYYQGTQEWPMLLKTDSLGNFTTGIEEFNIKVQNYSIIPNPVTEQSQLLFSNAIDEEHEFVLFDITGREAEKQRTRSSSITLTRSNHTAGIYIFKLRNTVTGEVINGKVVFQ